MDKLLLPEEVAELLRVKLSTIRKWCHRNYVPFRKIGRHVRFDPTELAEWLEKRKIEGRALGTVKLQYRGRRAAK